MYLNVLKDVVLNEVYAILNSIPWQIRVIEKINVPSKRVSD